MAKGSAIGYKAWILARRLARENEIDFHTPWRESFAALLRDLGTPVSQSAALTRIDEARGFVPGNVEWKTPSGWVIWDNAANLSGGREYVARIWETEREAIIDLADLLKPYPTGHEWRGRLEVREAGAKKK